MNYCGMCGAKLVEGEKIIAWYDKNKGNPTYRIYKTCPLFKLVKTGWFSKGSNGHTNDWEYYTEPVKDERE